MMLDDSTASLDQAVCKIRQVFVLREVNDDSRFKLGPRDASPPVNLTSSDLPLQQVGDDVSAFGDFPASVSRSWFPPSQTSIITKRKPKILRLSAFMIHG